MQTASTVEDVLKSIERFRILCVGRAGVGKSSVINRVFGVQAANVEEWKVGEADIDKEFTSPENRFFVLHDSKGFEPGDTKTFDIVSGFIKRRRDESLPLKDRLHAVWLCTETPRAGERIFEIGDEYLLQLAYETQTPVVVVFTKYDLLVRTKKARLRRDKKGLDSGVLDKRSEEEARKVLAMCVQSLDHTMNRMKAQMPRYANVSIYQGFGADISSLVDVTRDVVRETLKDAWVMWAIAQRASLSLKIEACVATSTNYYGRSLVSDMPGVERVKLRDCLAEAHQDIVTCWNFRDEEKILSGGELQQLMLSLVQEVQESQNHSESPGHYTPSPVIDKIFQFLSLITASPPTATSLAMTGVLGDWLKDAILHNSPQVQHLLMIYTADLTTVLKSLFEITVLRMPHSSERTTWLKLKEAFEAYEGSGSRQQIHHHICAIFQQQQQILDLDSFHRMFYELVKDAGGVSAPVTVPAPVATSSGSSPAPEAALEPASGPSRRRRRRFPWFSS